MTDLGSRQGELARLSNARLLESLSHLDGEHRRVVVDILFHLAEVGRRRLYVERGSSSLFEYCTKQLGWSESTSGRRIAVARAMERFPEIHELLLAGEVNLSTVAPVARLLDEENHSSLLERVRGKSRREVEAILAEFRPARKTRDRVRALGRRSTRGSRREEEPRRGATKSDSGEKAPSRETRPTEAVASSAEAPGRVEPQPRRSSGLATEAPQPTVGPQAGPAARGADLTGTAPLEEVRYAISFSVGEAFLESFERVRHLLSGRSPQGASYEDVFGTLIAEFLKREDPVLRAKRREARHARGQRGRSGETEAESRTIEAASATETAATAEAAASSESEIATETAASSTPTDTILRVEDQRREHSRKVPRPVRDEVYVRDGGRCTYVSPDGVRCLSRWDLEVDHIEPFCRGGSHSLDNLRIRCRSHNLLEARRTLGSELMVPYVGAGGPRLSPIAVEVSETLTVAERRSDGHQAPEIPDRLGRDRGRVGPRSPAPRVAGHP